MTALPLGDGDEWLIAAGFAGSIAKPIDIETLPELVMQLAARETN